MYIINEWETPAVYLVHRSASVITTVNSMNYYVPSTGNSYVCKRFLPLSTSKWSQMWEWGVSLFVYMYLSLGLNRPQHCNIWHGSTGKPWSLSSRKAGSVQRLRVIRYVLDDPAPQLIQDPANQARAHFARRKAAAAGAAVIQPQLSCLIPYLFLPQAMCFTFIWLFALMELLARQLASTRKTTHFSATHTLTRMQHALMIKNPWLCLEPLHYIISWQLRILGFLEGKFRH